MEVIFVGFGKGSVSNCWDSKCTSETLIAVAKQTFFSYKGLPRHDSHCLARGLQAVRSEPLTDAKSLASPRLTYPDRAVQQKKS